MRHADRVGDRAGAEHGLRRAARLGAVGVGIGPELQGDADHLGPALALEQGGDGAVDAARHGDEDASRRRVGEALGGGGGAGQGAVQGVGRELGGVSLGRGQAADLGVDLLDADAGGDEDGLAVDHLGRGGRGGAHRPAALGVEAGGGDPPVLDPQRDPREVAAGGAPGGAGEGALRGGPATRLVAQIVLEELRIHTARVRGASRRAGRAGDRSPSGAQMTAQAEKHPQVGRDRLRFVAQLTPGDPHRPPALGEQDPVAFAVRLKGAAGSRERPPVELDDQPLLVPEAVDLEEAAAAPRGRR